MKKKYINLFKVMEKIVENNMIAYKSDFYIHDKKSLLNSKYKGEKIYYWFVRDTGTHLLDNKMLFNKNSMTNIIAEYFLEYNPLIYKLTIEKVDRKYVYGNIQKLKVQDMYKLLNNIVKIGA